MKKFLSFLSDGKILAISTCIDSDFQLQTGYPDQVLEIPYDVNISWDTHYVEDNQIKKKQSRPTFYHVFNYITKQWEDLRTLDEKWNIIRQERDRLLELSDWTQLSDVQLVNKQSWITYRQALRDITTQADPLNVTWPVL